MRKERAEEILREAAKQAKIINVLIRDFENKFDKEPSDDDRYEEIVFSPWYESGEISVNDPFKFINALNVEFTTEDRDVDPSKYKKKVHFWFEGSKFCGILTERDYEKAIEWRKAKGIE